LEGQGKRGSTISPGPQGKLTLGAERNTFLHFTIYNYKKVNKHSSRKENVKKHIKKMSLISKTDMALIHNSKKGEIEQGR